MNDRTKAIKAAATVSLVGNAVLAAAKIGTGIFAGSLAVIGDGVDSSSDVVISIVALAAASIIAKPSDREHPYGHARAETTATTILAFIIFFAGAQLFLSSFNHLLSGVERALPAPLAIWVTLGSIVGKLLLAWSQYSAGRKTGSAMLVANGVNMRSDVIISGGVLVGLTLAKLLHQPIIDSITALAVSFWVMKSAVGIFREANDEIMDGRADPELYRMVFEAVRSVPGAGNPHRARVRKLASLYDIDLDIEIDASTTVGAAHEIAQAVETAIKERIDGVYDIVVHMEPAGAGEHEEQYGLNESCLDPVKDPDCPTQA
jgi:cation diffusion facilitator family transporter